MADLRLGPVYIGKLDLANTYIWICFLLKGTLSVVFLILRKKPMNDQLVCFHLSLPMGYMESAPYFCMSTYTIVDMANASMNCLHMASPHPLESLSDVPALSEQAPEQSND